MQGKIQCRNVHIVEIKSYVDLCTKELSHVTILAMWQGNQGARQPNVPYVAALRLPQNGFARQFSNAVNNGSK